METLEQVEQVKQVETGERLRSSEDSSCGEVMVRSFNCQYANGDLSQVVRD